MAARSIWNGTVAFGDVVVPVKLFSAVQEHAHPLPRGAPQRRLPDRAPPLSARTRGARCPPERIGKAYETSRGHQVVLEDEEIAAARGSRPKVIEIEHFVAGRPDRPRLLRPPLHRRRAGRRRARLPGAPRRADSAAARWGSDGSCCARASSSSRSHRAARRSSCTRCASPTRSSTTADLDVPALRREPSRQEIEMARRLIDTLAATVAAVQPQGPLPRRGDGRDRAQGRRRGGQGPGARAAQAAGRPARGARSRACRAARRQDAPSAKPRRRDAPRSPRRRRRGHADGSRTVERHAELRPRRRAGAHGQRGPRPRHPLPRDRREDRRADRDPPDLRERTARRSRGRTSATATSSTASRSSSPTRSSPPPPRSARARSRSSSSSSSTRSTPRTSTTRTSCSPTPTRRASRAPTGCCATRSPAPGRSRSAAWCCAPRSIWWRSASATSCSR